VNALTAAKGLVTGRPCGGSKGCVALEASELLRLLLLLLLASVYTVVPTGAPSTFLMLTAAAPAAAAAVLDSGLTGRAVCKLQGPGETD